MKTLIAITLLVILLFGTVCTAATVETATTDTSVTSDVLQTAVAELIAEAVNTVKQGKEFIVAELPEVVQQLLRWEFYNSAIKCVLGIMWVLFIIVVCIISIRYIKKFNFSGDPVFFLIVVVGAVGFILSLPGLCALNLTWLKILVAPKVYLIEYAATLLK